MTSRITFLAPLLVGALTAPAQGFSFLDITPDARSAALGGISTVIAPDGWAAAGNVARLAAGVPAIQGIAYSYSPGVNKTFPGSAMHALAAYRAFGARGTFSAAFKRVALGEIAVERVDGVGYQRPVDVAIDLGYARSLARGFSAGVTARYIVSDLDEQQARVGRGVAVNIGAYYYYRRRDIPVEWSVAILAANLGTVISRGGNGNALPAMVKAGVATRLPFNLHCALEYGYRAAPREARVHVFAVAVEYVLLDLLAIRGGYHRGDTRYLSAGCGVTLYHFSPAISWQKALSSVVATDNITRFSLAIDFGLFGK